MEIIVTDETNLVAIIENVIGKYLKQQPQPEEPKPRYWSSPDVFDVAEAAKYLGVGKSYITKLAAKGEIPCSKPFKRLRFEKAELDEWVKTRENKRGCPDISGAELAITESAQRRLRKNL